MRPSRDIKSKALPRRASALPTGLPSNSCKVPSHSENLPLTVKSLRRAASRVLRNFAIFVRNCELRVSEVGLFHLFAPKCERSFASSDSSLARRSLTCRFRSAVMIVKHSTNVRVRHLKLSCQWKPQTKHPASCYAAASCRHPSGGCRLSVRGMAVALVEPQALVSTQED